MGNFVCEYDFTTLQSDQVALNYFKELLPGLNRKQLHFINEDVFNKIVDYKTLVQLEGLDSLEIYNNGRYLRLVLNPGLNGESWFYILFTGNHG